MKTTATNVKLRKLLTDLRTEKLIPKPDFQRRLVWANKHKNAFVRTVLEGLPFPEIYIAAGDVDLISGEGKEVLVDGQQRLTTLFHYFSGSKIIKLERDIKPYKDLGDNGQKQFLEYDVVVRDLGAVEIDQIKEVFLRINSTSYSLNPMEINNARYDGAIKKFAEKISKEPFFDKNKIFSAADVRRMNDIRFVLLMISTILSTYFHREAELETFLEKYNDEFEFADNLEDELLYVFSFTDTLNFQPNARIWNKADLFTFIVELHKIFFKDKNKLKKDDLETSIKLFYDFVSNFNPEDPNPNTPSEAIQYYETIQRGTNDKGNRMKRGEIIASLLNKHII